MLSSSLQESPVPCFLYASADANGSSVVANGMVNYSERSEVNRSVRYSHYGMESGNPEVLRILRDLRTFTKSRSFMVFLVAKWVSLASKKPSK
jgi:hypothetical protein